MLIKFVLHRSYITNADKNPSYKLVGSGLSLDRYPPGYDTVSQEYIDIAQAIAKNADFLKFIKEYRQKYNIPPKGLPYAEYLKLSKQYKQKGLTNPYLKLYFDILPQIRKKRIKVFPIIGHHLHTLVIGGFIVAPKMPITIDYPVAGYEFEGITIQINNKQTIKDLIRYIKENEKALQLRLNKLPESDFMLSKDDILLINALKKQKNVTAAYELSSKNKTLNRRTKNISLDMFYKKTRNAKKMIDSLFSISS